MASITFKNIVKTYDNGVTVIPDLNLEIKDNNDKSFSEIERLLFHYEHSVHISVVPLQQQI